MRAAIVPFMIIVVFSLLIWFFVDVRSNPPPKPISGRETACYSAQLAIKEKLTNPGNATFLSCEDASTVIVENADVFLVRSAFEMPDPSGIRRSHPYSVKVKRLEGSTQTAIEYLY